jgi:hypothetical protein
MKHTSGDEGSATKILSFGSDGRYPRSLVIENVIVRYYSGKFGMKDRIY